MVVDAGVHKQECNYRWMGQHEKLQCLAHSRKAEVINEPHLHMFSKRVRTAGWYSLPAKLPSADWLLAGEKVASVCRDTCMQQVRIKSAASLAALLGSHV